MADTWRTWVRHFLALHEDPAAGLLFLGLHARDAYVPFQGKASKASLVDPDAFAQAHREANESLLSGGSSLPPILERLGRVEWQQTESSQGVLTAEVLSAENSETFWLVFGLRGAPDEWQVVWLGLEPHPVERSFALGGAAALAEMAFLPSQAGLPVRSWLDVSYRRHFRYARPSLHTLPDQRFSCHGTGSCCQIYWEITAPADAQALVDQVPWAELGASHLVGKQLEPHSEGRVYVKRGGERCAFLDENTRCRIHSALGTPVFDACVAFPFRFAEVPDGVAVTTSYHCHSARSAFGLPLAERQEDIWRRLNQVGLMVIPREGYALTPHCRVSWQAFVEIETQILDTLADPSIDLFKRLWVAARKLEAAVTGVDGHVDTYRQETPPPLTFGERALLDVMLPFWLGCVGKLRTSLAPLADARPASHLPQQPEQVSRWLRNTLLSKDLSYQFDLVTALSGVVIMYLAVIALEGDSGEMVSETCWADLGAMAAHNRIGAMFERLFSSAEYLRVDLASPTTPLKYLTWLFEQSRAPVKS